MRKRINIQGITMVSLGIIILVLLLLSGIVTYASRDIITEAKEVTYTKNMSSISDAVQEYYSVNGDLPILPNSEYGKELTKEQYVNAIKNFYGEEFSNALTQEIQKNGDESSIFYEIDISKLNIDELAYGTKKDDDWNDIFLVASDSNVVYYLKGIKISKKIYFSGEYLLNK